MAESTLAINTALITDLQSATNADQDVLDAINNEIVTKFNASLNTVTGHTHNDTDSPSISSGIGSLSISDYTHALILGGYQ